MPEPLTVTPAALLAAAATVGSVAEMLGQCVGTAGTTVDRAAIPATGWLTSAATQQVVTLAADRLESIAHDLVAVGAALTAAAASYGSADDRAARRSPHPDRAVPW